MNPQVLRQAKRLYLGNIPPNRLDAEVLKTFLNSALNAAMGKPADAPGLVGAVQLNEAKSFAFAEFETVEGATAAVALDGIMLEGNALKIRRPKDYQELPPGFTETGPRAAIDPSALGVGIVSTTVQDSPFKIFIGQLPAHLTEEQIMQLLASFGPLRAFNLVKDNATGKSKGYAFCEYADRSVTDAAIEGLNGTKIGDKSLVVQKSNPGNAAGPAAAAARGAAANPMAAQCLVMSVPLGNILANLPCVDSANTQPSDTLLLLNLFSTDKDLLSNEDHIDTLADLRDEMRLYGDLMDISLERAAGPGTRWVARITYAESAQAAKAQAAMSGRKFNGRAVVTTFA